MVMVACLRYYSYAFFVNIVELYCKFNTAAYLSLTPHGNTLEELCLAQQEAVWNESSAFHTISPW